MGPKLKRKSEWEKLYEAVDKADAKAAAGRSAGLDATELERYARILRINSYSFKRLSRTVMVELIKNPDPMALAKWDEMWEEMKGGRLHPRELKTFYDTLMAKKRISNRT